MNWEKVALGDLITISKGKKHSETNAETDYRYLQIEDLNGNFTKKYTNERGTYVNEKDIIIVWDGANAGKVGCGFTGVIGSTLARLSFKNDNVEARFVKRYLDYKFEYIKSQRTGATIPHVSGDALKSLKIPLPTYSVQQKIADILDYADNLRQKDQQLLKKYDGLQNSLFYQMFGDLGKNELGWNLIPFGDVIMKLDAGTSMGGEERPLKAGELGVLKISAVTSGRFKELEFKVPDQLLIPKNPVTVEKGDLLFSRANTRELVGAVAIVDHSYPYLMLPDKLWKIRLDNEKILPGFCWRLLWDKSVRFNLTKTATGTSGSMLNISMGKLRDLKIPIPPINIQRIFVERMNSIQIMKSTAIKAEEKSEILFESLLQKAFKGELVK